MELPKISMGDIKSKLGFADGRDAGYDEEYYDDYADDYGDDYGEYGYDAEPADNPSKRYEPYSKVTTRPALGTRTVSSPKLVSIDDVRERTQVPDSLRRDPLPARHVSSASRSYGNRTMVDSTLPAPGSESATQASSSARRGRSEGYESLFSSTAEAAGRLSQAGSAGSGASAGSAVSAVSGANAGTTGAAGAGAGTASAVGAGSQRSSFDPYATYQGAGSAYSPQRSVTVLKPVAYAEVERISKSLRAGDAVVLCLGNTPDHLAKRILDFAFGAASMVDARVDCVAEKVFAVARGQELSEAERTALRNKGVL